MTESTDAMFKNGQEKMEKALNQLHRDFSTVRTGRANPTMLDKVMVEYYGAPTPLKQMAQITVQEGTTLVIAPFDRSIIKEIEKGRGTQFDPKYADIMLSIIHEDTDYNLREKKNEE